MMLGSHAPPAIDVIRHNAEVKRAQNRVRELVSMRADMNLKLEVARKFRGERAIYYPHNLDFRGRAYPMHPHLNHLGSDMCRGLLHFAEAKPLGPTGLRWLKIQLANLYGNGADKRTMDGRASFADDHLAEVMDSADDPLGGRRWWTTADQPFQCLATCMELARALRHGDPEEYPSSLPIHQDGSCNGLQHYAALGRDVSGAGAVNLLPGEEPADVYSSIARLVQQRVVEDARAGIKEAQALEREVDRKLIKQTVMTSVYGVTFIGAKMQIENRLRERGWPKTNELHTVAKYGARVTFEAMHTMFKSAKDIMHWLSTCAKVVTSSGNALEWTTPLGLPVCQPYRLRQRYAVRTVLQSIIVIKHNARLPVAPVRQRQAFPPNYIHSIDSTHMMMTAVRCREEGLAFAGVHDSFWTHAGSVDRMNANLRDTFIELHSRPLLDELLAELQQQFPGLSFPPVPTRGELDLTRIRESEYFFS